MSVCYPWAKQSEQFIGVTISNRNHLFYNPHSLRMAQRAKTTMSNINNISLFFLDKILSLRYSQTKLQRKAKRRIHSFMFSLRNNTHSMEKYEKFNHLKCICSMYNTHTAHTHYVRHVAFAAVIIYCHGIYDFKMKSVPSICAIKAICKD